MRFLVGITNYRRRFEGAQLMLLYFWEALAGCCLALPPFADFLMMAFVCVCHSESSKMSMADQNFSDLLRKMLCDFKKYLCSTCVYHIWIMIPKLFRCVGTTHQYFSILLSSIKKFAKFADIADAAAFDNWKTS